MKYLLFAFGAYQNNEKLTKEIALQLAPLCAEDQNIKYSYGEQNMIIYFNSEIDLDQVKKFVSFIMTKYSSMYFLMPCTDNLSYFLPKDLKKTFFPRGDQFSKNMVKNVTEDEISEIIENIIEENDPNEEIETAMRDIVSSENDGDDMYQYDENEGDSELERILSKSKNETKVIEGPTLDQLLDKISAKGINSLSKKEKEQLDKYSKQ